MPKRTNLKSILIIGSGPIVIGQGCEFDYSGVQACRALKAEGYRIILINSNPATIMTDPEMCDATYIEPIHWTVVAKIIEQERPDALLPTMGGQTALNCAMELAKHGVLKQFSVELIGASLTAIQKAEDREQFRKAMQKIGLESPKATIAHTLEEALEAQTAVGFPTVIRPSFTLGGSGGGIAYNKSEFETICRRGFMLSPTHELLIEESLLGWKEFELEVVRDKKDNCIIVCTIENVDPMGIHTGDSITVAPAQTLTDKEYQSMRNAAIAILREIGVETGGANVQFAVHPKTGRMIVIEMNPRVSRSSALASKATGFPIAKVAAKLAIGYTLDELQNDITKNTMPASFEPTIDYVVTKIPRFNFEKFANADNRLTTQMKSVGEIMSIGRTFQESLQKALCSLENGFDGFKPLKTENLLQELEMAGPNRLCFIAEGYRAGLSSEMMTKLTGIDPWFIAQIEELIQLEKTLVEKRNAAFSASLTQEELFFLKQKGFSDRRLANLLNLSEEEIRGFRHTLNIHPVFKRVDSCAAEFPSNTAYLYSTYEEECEAKPTQKEKIMILGSGPNRIGQGIEFDYCCVHAAIALQEAGFETIMVNCNPETVSTDYDISNRLYFEPLTLEHVLAIVNVEKPKGVIVQFGGQTPLKLTKALEKAGVTILGTSSDSIDCAEDRKRFSQLLTTLGLKQPEHGIAHTVEEGLQHAERLGFPLVVRPSYVLGGRAMEIVHTLSELKYYLEHAVIVSEDSPVLIDRFLENAIEVDVDAVSDGKAVYIGGILEHAELAGVHSGDSACSLPPFRLGQAIQERLREQVTLLTKALKVVGPINAQFAIQNNDIFVIEVNPRASRTVPFVSKATGIPLAKIAARCMIQQTLAEQNIQGKHIPNYFSVKLPVFPFGKFPEYDPTLGPEMKSTGEVMATGKTFNEAFMKSTLGIWPGIKNKKQVFLSVKAFDNTAIVVLAKALCDSKFTLIATEETATALETANVECIICHGKDLNTLSLDDLAFAIVTTENREILNNLRLLRSVFQQQHLNYITTLPGAEAFIASLKSNEEVRVSSLQTLHQSVVAV